MEDMLEEDIELFTEEELRRLSVKSVANIFRGPCEAILKPKVWRYPWQWAEENCYLTSRTSAEVGAYSSARTPYVREIMESLSPRVRGADGVWRRSIVDTVVFQKGTQVGGTLSLLYWLCQGMEEFPGPSMVVFPTVENAKKWSKVKLDEVLQSTPTLRKIVTNAKEREFGNETLAKYFPGGFLAMVGSNSPAGLRMLSVRNVGCDDFDGFAESAGGEGSPADLVEKRQSTFADSKTFLVSTPTIKGASNIEHAYLLTDQRRYFVPCPHCQEYQTLEWKQLDWPSGKPEKAKMVCVSCSKTFENKDKNWMLPRGEWRATCETPRMQTWRGYHLSALYSPHGWKANWVNQAKQHVAAKGNPNKLQVFVNTVLAETWESHQVKQEVGPVYLYNRRETYNPAVVPESALVVVAAIDVQGDRLEVLVDAYGLDRECWHLEYHILQGAPTFVDLRPESGSVWRNALDVVSRPRLHAKYGDMKILATCVDTGGACTQACYDAVARAQEQRVTWWAIKGKSGTEAVWPRRRSSATVKRTLQDVPLYVICSDTAKGQIYDSLALEQPGPGFRHYPQAPHCDEEFFEQLLSERRVREFSKGAAVDKWVLPPGRRNEVLDLSAYTLAALCGLERSGLNLEQRARFLATRVVRPEGSPPRGRRRGSSGVQV